MAHRMGSLPLTISRNLGDRSYDKRKAGALEIENMVKHLHEEGNQGAVEDVIMRLIQDFACSTNANQRKGGLIGLAGVGALVALVPLYRRRFELGGLLLAPAQTFRHLAAQPDWKGPVLMVLIGGLIGAIGAATLLLEQTQAAAVPTIQAVFTIVGLVLIFPGVVLMAGLAWIAETALLWILTRLAGQAPSYMAVLCSTGYANMPSALLGSVVTAIAILAGYDLSQGSPLSLDGLWPGLAAGNAVITSRSYS